MVQTNTPFSFTDASNQTISGIDHENTGVTTGAAYADALVIPMANYNSLILTLTETGAAQSFYYQVLGSIKSGTTQPTAGATPDASYRTLVTNVSVAASGGDYQILAGPWKWVVVQVKNNSGAATVTARARGV